MFTCSKLLPSEIEGLHLHLEGVDGQLRVHNQSLLLAAHVGEPQGASQVVQTAVLDKEGLYSGGQSREKTKEMRGRRRMTSVFHPLHIKDLLFEARLCI